MDECFIESAEAHQQSLLEGAIDACRRAAGTRDLVAVGMCHNCHAPVPDGATFCDYIEPGDSEAACLIDWRARQKRGMR